MTISKKGIQALLVCTKGQLGNATPSRYYLSGLKQSAELAISADKNPRTDRNIPLPNLEKHELKCRSYQVNLHDLENFIAFADESAVDAQMLLPERWTANNHKALNYGSSDFLGFEFNYVLSSTERYVDLSLARSFSVTASKNIISASYLTNNEHAIFNSVGTGNAGNDITKVGSPDSIEVNSPDGTALFEAGELISRKLEIKSVGDAGDDGRVFVDWVDVKVEVSLRNASAQKMLSLQNMSRISSLRIKERGPNGVLEHYICNAGTVGNTIELRRGNEVYSKIVFEGRMPLNCVSFDFSDADEPKVSFSL